MDMCQTTLTFSFTLTVLKTPKLPMFVLASRTLLRATLPKGVLNWVFAVGVFAIKRTSLLVTTVAGFAGSGRGGPVGLAGLVIVPVSPLLIPLKLTKVVGVIAGFPQRLSLISTAHASPANIPTEVTGALRLPKKGLSAWSTVP